MIYIKSELKELYFSRALIMDIADKLLIEKSQGISQAVSLNSPGGSNDYYSNGDYWWPNPDTETGIPYIQKDGETNPDNFSAHRLILRKMRRAVSYLAAAWTLTDEDKYSHAAFKWLDTFFINEKTKMNPHLCYAQAIPGVCEGRGIGIIDTLHLIEVTQAIETLKPVMSEDMYQGMVNWFKFYLVWLNNHPNSIQERDWHNNHSVAWLAQVAAFARFTKDKELLKMCRERYKYIILPRQMHLDGSFPKELERTKPYSYSNFVLDNMVNICLFAAEPEDDLWQYKDENGRSLQLGLDFLVPFIAEKEQWPYAKDIQHFQEWPVGMSFLLFSGLKLNNEKYIDLWSKLEQLPENEEILRNMAIQCPMIYLNSDLGECVINE